MMTLNRTGCINSKKLTMEHFEWNDLKVTTSEHEDGYHMLVRFEEQTVSLRVNHRGKLSISIY